MQVTTAQLSSITGLSPTALRVRAKKYAMPGASTSQQGRKVTWDLTVTIPWLLNFNKTQYGSDADSKNLAYERQRLLKAQADHEELDYAVKCKQYMRTDIVIDILAGLMAIIISAIRNLGGRLANELVGEYNPAVIKERIDNEVGAARTAMVREAAEQNRRIHEEWPYEDAK
jgi:phage terminase Nu1 subunit (DNA packaging protein)